MITPTDDPYKDFDRWDAEQEKLRKRLPVCDDCKNRIDDDFFKIDNEILCGDCLHDRYRVYIDDYLYGLEE